MRPWFSTRRSLIGGAIGSIFGAALLLPAAGALAQTPPPTETAPPAAAATPPPAPPPYSLPWQLRPSQPVNVVRLDTTFDFASGPDGATDAGNFSMAMMLLGSYKLIPELSVAARLGIITMSPDADGVDGGTAFLNPVIGATYGITIAEQFRLAFWLGVAVPLGTAGGDDPDPGVALANRVGFLNRSNLDNAMFAHNYLTVFPGVDFAWVAHGFTVQAEVMVLELIRVRGPDMQGTSELDDARTNLTFGLHVGYFIIPQLSVSGELRQQLWLAVEDFVADTPARHQTSFALGVRGHIKLSPTMVLRPGIAYAMGIDPPMAGDTGNNDHIIQLDVPLNF